MKKIKKLRPMSMAAIILLCAVFCQGQQGLTSSIWDGGVGVTGSIDTVKVVLLVGDTSHRYKTYFKTKPCKDTTNKLVLCGDEIKEDMGNSGYGQSYWVYGYEVRRKECCINSYYSNFTYSTHLGYLDDKKQPLKSTVIVWLSVLAK